MTTPIVARAIRVLGEDAQPSRVFLVVVVLLVPLYSATAAWSLPYHVDPGTNLIAAWTIGTRGTFVATDHSVLLEPDAHGLGGWVEPSPRGPVARYPPGAALVYAPAYAVADVDLTAAPLEGSVESRTSRATLPLPALWPGTLGAVLVTAVAMGGVAAAVRTTGAAGTQSVAMGIVAGTASGAWSVASNMTWMHGPAMASIALALWAAGRQRWLAVGLALGAGVLVRPHVAVIAAVMGVGVARAQRRVRPALEIAGGSLVGLVALVAYNAWAWGDMGISGGYGDEIMRGATEDGVLTFLTTVASGLVAPRYGLLWWAPFLVVLIPAAWRARRDAPDWVWASALGGVFYLAVQWRLNRASGGFGFFAYRYPLEAMTAAAPVLWFGWRRLIDEGTAWWRVARLLLVTSVAGQAAGAVLT